MGESPEHKFLAKKVDSALTAFAATGLLGVIEADRRKFDYACRLERDFSRGLVSQVCWGNVLGINKDIELLLLDTDAPIKLYLLPDTQKARLRLDETIGRYEQNPATRFLLKGFRFFAIPTGFDADDDVARDWMSRYLRERMCADLLFGIVFGRLTTGDVIAFASHSGPFGLKFALLDRITRQPIASMREIYGCLQYRSKSSIREALVMLTSTGLLFNTPAWHPTIKGRFLLDLIRRLFLEAVTRSEWSEELGVILSVLGITKAPFLSLEHVQSSARTKQRGNLSETRELIEAALFALTEFGIDPLEGVDRTAPILHSDFDWRRFDHLAPNQRLSL